MIEEDSDLSGIVPIRKPSLKERACVSNSLRKALMTHIAVTEHVEYLIPLNFSLAFKIPIHVARAAMDQLNGTFLRKGQVLSLDDEVSYGHGNTIVWDGSQWVTPSSPPLSRYQIHPRFAVVPRNKRTGVLSKKEKQEWARKNPPKVVDWNGTVYFINPVHPEYQELRRSLGLYENPFVDWNCPGCSRVNKAGSTYCRKCTKNRDPFREAKPKDVEEAGPPKCKRCGSVIKFHIKHGKKKADHSLAKCNLLMVSGIMDE